MVGILGVDPIKEAVAVLSGLAVIVARAFRPQIHTALDGSVNSGSPCISGVSLISLITLVSFISVFAIFAFLTFQKILVVEDKLGACLFAVIGGDQNLHEGFLPVEAVSVNREIPVLVELFRLRLIGCLIAYIVSRDERQPAQRNLGEPLRHVCDDLAGLRLSHIGRADGLQRQHKR